jgi:hypothetical protein
MRPVVVFIAAAMSIAAPAFADFSYQETIKMTGGMMMQNGNTPPPQESATFVKGNRMARLGPDHGQITDLDKQTITNLNFKNKTYSVMTFAQMKAMMSRLAPNTGKPPASADVQSRETGKTRVIGNATAKEVLVTVKVSGSEIVEDVWLAPMVAGYDEVRKFQSKMALQMGADSAPGIQRTIAEAAKVLYKVNGVPLQKTSSITTKMPPPAPGAPPQGNGPLMQLSTEMRGLSSAAVDASKFEVPAGFKKVEQNMGGAPPNAQRPPAPAPPHQ